MNGKNSHIKITERVSSRLKLKQLRLLVAISAHSSILHAARELNISQPAATKLLKDLELDFGVQLFERTNRGAVATPFGEALVRHGKLILAQISHAAQELDDLSEGTGGRVVIGTLLAASAVLLPQTIKRVHAQRPNVSIAIREGTNDVLMPALRSGDCDMVVGRLPEFRYRDELVQETFFAETSCIVARAGHPLAGQDSLDFSALVACDWILPPPETTLRRQVDKAFLDSGYPPPPNAVESISFLNNRNLLLHTDMLLVVPQHVVEQEIRMGLLTVIPFDLATASGTIGVSYRRDAGLSPAAKLVLEELRETARQRGGG